MYFLGLNDLKTEGDFRWLDYVDDVREGQDGGIVLK